MKVGFAIDNIRRVQPYRINLTPQDIVKQVRPGLGAILTRGRRTETGIEYPIIDLPAAGQLNGWFDSTVKWIGTAATNTWNWMTGKPASDYETVYSGQAYTAPDGKMYRITDKAVLAQYQEIANTSGTADAVGWLDTMLAQSPSSFTPTGGSMYLPTVRFGTPTPAPAPAPAPAPSTPFPVPGRTTIPATGASGTNILPQIMGYLAWVALPADQKANYRYDPVKGVAEYIGPMSATDVSGNIGNVGGGAVSGGAVGPSSGIDLNLNQWMPWILAIAGGLILINMTRGGARE